jgi:hypothetical protein
VNWYIVIALLVVAAGLVVLLLGTHYERAVRAPALESEYVPRLTYQRPIPITSSYETPSAVATVGPTVGRIAIGVALGIWLFVLSAGAVFGALALMALKGMD